MTIYYDYTAGRGKYDAEYEENNGKRKQQVIINFVPCQKPNAQFKKFTYNANSNFYYSYEQSNESQKTRYFYNNQQNTQRPRKIFNQSQNTYKKQYNTSRYKKGNNRRNVDIVLGSRYQKNDIQE